MYYIQRQKTAEVDPYFDESRFVKPASLDKYRCIHCKKVPTTFFRRQCCDAGKEEGVSCSECKTACERASCGKDDYKSDGKAYSNIRKLQAFCPNKENGCLETKPYHARDEHVKCCEHTRLPCKYQESVGCDKMLLKEEKETHEKDVQAHFDLLMDAFLALKKQVNSPQGQSSAVPSTPGPVIPGPIPLVGDERISKMND